MSREYSCAVTELGLGRWADLGRIACRHSYCASGQTRLLLHCGSCSDTPYLALHLPHADVALNDCMNEEKSGIMLFQFYISRAPEAPDDLQTETWGNFNG